MPTISEEESESAGTGYFGPGELTVAQKEVEKAGWDSACALGSGSKSTATAVNRACASKYLSQEKEPQTHPHGVPRRSPPLCCRDYGRDFEFWSKVRIPLAFSPEIVLHFFVGYSGALCFLFTGSDGVGWVGAGGPSASNLARPRKRSSSWSSPHFLCGIVEDVPPAQFMKPFQNSTKESVNATWWQVEFS